MGISKKLVQFFTCVTVLAMAGNLGADVPQIVQYQGYLADVAGTPVSGDWTMTFSLFDDEFEGSVQHEETLDIAVDFGVFSALLGAGDAPLDLQTLEGAALWMQVTINADDGPVTLLPRQRVVSAPYALLASHALQADNSATVGGIAPETFATVEQIAEMCIAPDQLGQALSDLGFESGPHYGDDDVAAFLEQNGYAPETSPYTDQQVQEYLEAQGYVSGPHYEDENVQAWLDQQGYFAGTHYSDDDVQAWLDQQGYQQGVHYTDGDAQAWLDLQGYVAGQHFTGADVQAWLDLQGYVSGPHFSGADVQAWLDLQGYVTGQHYSDANTQSWLDLQGYVSGPHLSIEQCLEAVDQQGYLKPGQPIPASMLPPDGLDEVSNNLLTTTFDAVFNSANPVAIIDGFLAGVDDTITVPDVGTIQELTVQLDISHEAPEDLKVTLETPSGELLVLHDHGPGVGDGLQTVFDTQTLPVEGNLAFLDGLSPAGTWSLHIVDDVLTADGTLNGWSIQVESLSAQNVLLSGSLEVEGTFALAASNVNRGTLEVLTAGQDSVADGLHTHTNLAVYFKENTGVWSGGGGQVSDTNSFHTVVSGSITPSDPSTATLTYSKVSISGNHSPGWAGYVCLCAKGSITSNESGTVQLEEKCGGATNQQVAVSWTLSPPLVSSSPGSIVIYGKSCGGGINFSGASITGDQYLPVRKVD